MGKKTIKKQLELAKKITKNLSIPSRPSVMLEVSRLSSHHEPNWRNLSYLIRGDMALAAAVLHEANTSRSKKKHRTIASVEKAIIWLGWQNTRKLLEKMFLSHSLIGQESLAQQVREQGVVSAETAMWLVRRITNISPHFRNGCYPLLSLDQTYISALFLDSGMIAMEQAFPDYPTFLKKVRQKREKNLIEAENRAFGTNHTLASYLLAERWKLPKPVCQIILDHHKAEIFNQPGRKVKHLKYTILHGIILIVGYLSNEISLQEWEPMEDRILAFFEITHKDIENLAEALQAENLNSTR
ncbi:MAG: HDOD domain-containing protein [Magnetococcales bacterium]|nr:HDOD domain-containing protein [Magnetococcales bacterium]